ncbi:MAG: NADH-quinone oxidoreductase subunit NuoF [Candidatus Eremiobacteraeota bacterium]|nr:NADH-quinone oxidoreductase subunit NuoF [Candidatus Eremiobacteraeota bacterium]MBC5826845.1 NADH-quinone oxidoreductase subunit NuoF [Candidatus Eremiobacteraeota bacterium]
MATFEPVLTKGVGQLDLTDVAAYRKNGGFVALEKALKDMTPESIIAEVTASNLRGRGGAGFPTGKKWGFLPKDGRPRYLVCNCDEAEPGTFKDHMLLEQTPLQLIEGLILSAYAINAAHIVVYIRGEFLEGYRIFMRALSAAREAGYVGDNLLGSGYSADILVHRGAGAYICGEETAMLESIEGKRGEPRLKPPFPANAGLFGMPTVVNNVETLCCIPHILTRGAAWFASIGPPKSPGPKIISVSGQVQKPGNYEIPMGLPAGELLQDYAGGLLPGRTLKAIQPGGGSSAAIFAEDLHTGIDYDSLAAKQTMLGSGGFVVMDDTTCMVRASMTLVRFFEYESCGQCTPCREGGQWVHRILRRLEAGEGSDADLLVLNTINDTLTGTNLCPLGDSIMPFLLSVLRRFPQEFAEHVTLAGCPFDPARRMVAA